MLNTNFTEPYFFHMLFSFRRQVRLHLECPVQDRLRYSV